MSIQKRENCANETLENISRQQAAHVYRHGHKRPVTKKDKRQTVRVIVTYRHYKLTQARQTPNKNATHSKSIFYSRGILSYRLLAYLLTEGGAHFVASSKPFAVSLCWSTSQLLYTTPRRADKKKHITGRWSWDWDITLLSTRATGTI